MSTENHLGLPEEVFEMILYFLDVPDLLSCSLVCSGWRNAANRDCLWENCCRRLIPSERLQSNVPSMEWFLNLEPSPNLTQLCPWRLVYGADVHLKNQWKCGTAVPDGGCSALLEVERLQEPENVFDLSNEVILERPFGGLFGRGIDRGSFITYELPENPTKIEGSKIFKKAKYYCSIRSSSPDFFKIVGDKLVAVQGTLLQVYVKSDRNDFDVKLVALFDHDISNSPEIPHPSDLDGWYDRRIGNLHNMKVQCDHNGKYFIGMDAGSHGRRSLHIWDLSKLTKIGVITPADVLPGHCILSYALRGNVIHFIMIEESMLETEVSNGPSVLRSYDIEAKKYWHKGLKVNSNYLQENLLFTDDLLITTDSSRQVISFHHFKPQSLSPPTVLVEFNGFPSRVESTWTTSGLLLAFAKRDLQSEPTGLTLIERLNNLNLPPRESPIVNVYDLSEFRFIDEFKPREVGGPRCNVHKIDLFYDDLMLVGLTEHVLLRDIKKRVSLRKLDHAAFLEVSPSCTKALVYYYLADRIGVLFYNKKTQEELISQKPVTFPLGFSA